MLLFIMVHSPAKQYERSGWKERKLRDKQNLELTITETRRASMGKSR